MIKLTFGEKLRNLREDANLKQADLAKQINMTQRKVSYIECNRNEPNSGDILAICKYSDVSSDYMLGLSDTAMIRNNLVKNKQCPRLN